MRVELAHDARHVRLHRGRGNDQLLGNLLVAHAARNHAQNLTLAVGEHGKLHRSMRIARTRIDERLDKTTRNGRLNEGIAIGHRANGTNDVVGLGILQHEATSPSLQSIVHVFIDVERGKHEHARSRKRGFRDDLARGGDAVFQGHANIHEHHVGMQFHGAVVRGDAVVGLAHHLHVIVRGNDQAEAVAHQVLVVNDENGHVTRVVERSFRQTGRLLALRAQAGIRLAEALAIRVGCSDQIVHAIPFRLEASLPERGSHLPLYPPPGTCHAARARALPCPARHGR